MNPTLAQKWRSVTVVGCGLVGASFALALKRAEACERVAGWDASPSALDEALRRGAVEEVDDAFARGGVSESDLIYLAMPVGEIVRFFGERGRQVKPGAVLTDAGSTKLEVCRAARAHLPADRIFVGGHPVAGSHLRGPAHARAELFDGAPYVLTNGVDESDADERQGLALAALAETLRSIGARVTLLTASEHDRLMAYVSHLPQLVSCALAAAVRERPDAEGLAAVAGAGYRDMTRLAESSWSIWRDILRTNRAPVADALDALVEKLSAARDELRAGEGDELKLIGSLFGLPGQSQTENREAKIS